MKGDIMEYVTKKCPHCGHAYETMHAGSDKSFNSSIMRCEKCGGFFVDKDRQEIALTDTTEVDIPEYSGCTVFKAVIFTIRRCQQ